MDTSFNDIMAFSAPHKLPQPRSPQIRPKLGIRKRKPRSTTTLTTAPNSPASLPHPAPPARVAADPAAANASLPPPPQPPSPGAPPAPPPPPISEHKRKGLRHFAVRVTRKVEQKGVTTYNEVADELVAEERALRADAPLIDEKNIRRRVYDSLNVLMAMNIISKTKKQISWQGLHCARGPHDRAHDLSDLHAALDDRRAAVERKRNELLHARELLTRTAAVVDRNRDVARARDDPFAASNFFADFAASSPFELQNQQQHPHYMYTPYHQQHYYQQYQQQHASHDPGSHRLAFPFYVVSAKKETKIEMEVSSMRDEVRFTFDSSYEIFDNNEILRRIPVAPPFVFPPHDT